MRRLAALPIALALTAAIAANAVESRTASTGPSSAAAAPAAAVASRLLGASGPADASLASGQANGSAGRVAGAAHTAAAPVPPVPVGPPKGLPSGIPAPALKAEDKLPIPQGWPFDEAFPRTSGTSRLVPGAFEYSDFLYDDHGAAGAPRGFPIAGLAPSDGTFEYAPAAAKKNGADIFRVGIGHDVSASYWRVDWTTLIDQNVPVAEFAIDSTPDAGAAAWPGVDHLASPGIDKALVVSAQGAWVLDGTGAKTAVAALGGSLTVDMAAKSFVVRLPEARFATGGKWTVRVASGVANAAGDGFAPVDSDHGALPNQPPVFNVGFRNHDQEPMVGNYWMEDAQAAALAAGDVAKFGATVDWSDLASGKATPEPLPTGYTNRWYVSSITVGDASKHEDQGVVADTGGGTGDLKPNFLGRVQPYAVFVPSTYKDTTGTPLTWVLHSLSEQHNQYGALAPNFLTQACEDRGSICATTLGRGPDGWYFDEAELDFWEVWNRLANTYNIDADRTVISGYSMGGWATYKLGLAHPDLFAKAVVLAGPPQCGLRVADGYGFAGGAGRCTTDGNGSPFIENARSLPYYIAHGTDDELVPVTSVLEHVDHFRALGLRYRFELYPGMDHLGYGAADHFKSAAAHMGTGVRETDPSRVTYRWYPNLDRPEWNMRSTSAYWLSGLQAAEVRPGLTARVDAESSAVARPSHKVQFAPGADVPGDPSPAVVTEQTWADGPVDAALPVLSLDLTNIGSVTINVARAGFAPGTAGHLDVVADRAGSVVLHTSKGDVTVAVSPGHGPLIPFTA
ncbi:MAG: hypothetical protein QOI20_903 [Acidimicrobiaceae bacterium]|jgi:hypothetical protein|nr:hypothetical protein [Acidimicrobiaceae bacterium]